MLTNPNRLRLWPCDPIREEIKLREGDCSRTPEFGLGLPRPQVAGQEGGKGGAARNSSVRAQHNLPPNTMGNCPNLSLHPDMVGPENSTRWYRRLQL